LFARNMFIRPPEGELADFRPAFTILHAPDFKAIPELDGIRSETFILVNFAAGFVLIGGTRYAGEIKKSVFGYLNFVLPTRDVLPMHCSANVGAKGDCAIFFVLSVTGKTTLSADASRTLIGNHNNSLLLIVVAYRVMQSIAKLTSDMAMSYLLYEYNVQVTMSEVGIQNQPKALYFTCFRVQFMTRNASEYAKMLGQQIERFNAD